MQLAPGMCFQTAHIQKLHKTRVPYHAGKNRPLDEDELGFVERLLDQERQ